MTDPRLKWQRNAAALLALITLVPLVPLLMAAFARHWRFPDLLPRAFSARGLRQVLDPGGQALEGLVQSLVIGLGTALLTLLVALPAGYALGDRGFRGPLRSLVVFLLLLPILVSPLAAVMGIHAQFIALGLADSVPGVVLVHLIPAVPYATLIIAARVAGQDSDTEAVARTLGAGPWRTFFLISLPRLRPALVVAAFIAFLVSWGQYLLTLVIGGGLVKTLPLVLFSAASGSDPVITATVGLLFALPALLALPFVLGFLQERRPVHE